LTVGLVSAAGLTVRLIAVLAAAPMALIIAWLVGLSLFVAISVLLRARGRDASFD
jgi:hypothetical protein